MCRYGFVAEGVEDVAFGSYGGSLDLLFGVAGDEEESGAWLVGGCDGTAGDWEGLGGGCIPKDAGRITGEAAKRIGLLRVKRGFSIDDGGGDDGVTFLEGGRNGDEGVRGNGNFDGAEAAGGLGEGGGGAAVGPAAAEGDVDAEAESAAFGLGVVDGVEHGGGEEGEVLQVFGWI